jgi:hypothetical protein
MQGTFICNTCMKYKYHEFFFLLTCMPKLFDKEKKMKYLHIVFLFMVIFMIFNALLVLSVEACTASGSASVSASSSLTASNK